MVTNSENPEFGCSTSHVSTRSTAYCSEAYRIGKWKTVTVSTDYPYAFGVVPDFGVLWRCSNFLKSDGNPVLSHVIVDLLQAILLPSENVVCKCSAQDNLCDPISQDNARTDTTAAKQAATVPAHLDDGFA